MFKRGGPADQGTGILSHVEPRRIHAAMGGRIGLARGLTPSWYSGSSNSSGGDILNAANNNLNNDLDYYNEDDSVDTTYTPASMTAFGANRGIDSLRKKLASRNTSQDTSEDTSKTFRSPISISRQLGDQPGVNWRKLLPDNRSIRQRREDEMRRKDTGPELGNPEGESVWGTVKNPTPDIPQKEPEFTDTTKTDPKEEIRKDAALLQELLHGENYQELTKGEAALVIARALAEPGPIANKMKVASELSIPLMKAKQGEDKEAVLEAYKAYREREKAEITAGKQGVLEKDARALTAAYIAAHGDDPDTKTAAGRAKIYQSMLNQRLSGEDKISEKSKWAIWQNRDENAVHSALNQKEILEEAARNGKLSKDQQKSYEDILKKLSILKNRYPEQFKVMGYAIGGRVKLADGTPDPEDQEDSDTETANQDNKQPTVESTSVSDNAGTSQDQLKPVRSLSYQELRSRLPKEINNDIVGLLSVSKEALQDFAYIKTQQDVNNFNVKYGVNLVLPSTG